MTFVDRTLRAELTEIMLDRLRRVLAVRGVDSKGAFDESTVLIGSSGAVLDSLGWVLFLVDVEESLAERFPDGGSAVDTSDLGAGIGAQTVGSLLDAFIELHGGVAE
jgi:hypothetical protein